MIEYHGWAKISQSIDGENEKEIENIINEIEDAFTKSTIINETYNLSNHNGFYFLGFSGSHNHDGDTLDRLLLLMKLIGKKAPGSHGILFFWDDEHEEYWNEFQVYKLARGKIEFERDTYLSPCNPTIEE